MTIIAKQVLEQAMNLNEQDRVEIIDQLNDSIATSSDPEYNAAWEAELRDRIRQIEQGEVKTIPWREALEQIRRGVIDDK